MYAYKYAYIIYIYICIYYIPYMEYLGPRVLNEDLYLHLQALQQYRLPASDDLSPTWNTEQYNSID